ncbi:YhfX family PLP-dependent enzyme [Vibrio sp. F74]|uniref:YhfX family PLP-dependent enzyme n=1 Tax=Vibrio sp. F74 TaxID=700020 RepID=UPI0035F586B3
MFLDALEKQNSSLINAAIALHANGELLPDSYIIDVEQFRKNALKIKQQADALGIKLYCMTKQFGRNPYLAKLLEDMGFEGVVAVDFKEARVLHKSGIKISHIGHLVQPPESMLREIIRDIQPEVITVYSLEKAQSISKIASELNVKQRILVKFYDKDDLLYINQESGFSLSTMSDVLAKLSKLEGIIIEGITHFPCFLHDGKSVKPTNNLKTLLSVKKNWPSSIQLNQLNIPSATCCETLPMIHDFGGTHGEPGHALTGTFPANADGSQPEKIAMLYLSEVSHHYVDDSYCFAGGYYRRGHLNKALVNGQKVLVSNDEPSSIDYHLKLAGKHAIGLPVIMAFRTQIFVTRSDVVLVDGIQTGSPKIIGRYTALGDPINE